MSYSPRHRHSSPGPQYHSRTRSRSPTRSYRETSEDANNPGNNLYVTGLSMRVSEKKLQDHFEQEGKCQGSRLLHQVSASVNPRRACHHSGEGKEEASSDTYSWPIPGCKEHKKLS